MSISFEKYHGTGNDFIIINDVDESFPATNQQLIASMCERRFGIGADGLMLVQKAEDFDFRMVYFNADGSESTMCGNGGRCISLFAKEHLNLGNHLNFIAIDGPHTAVVEDGMVKLEMGKPSELDVLEDAFTVDTGSPHYVKVIDSSVEEFDIHNFGKEVRYGEPYVKTGGINVNVMNVGDDALHVRTYERGVEAETFSCGTGVTACALVAQRLGLAELGKEVAIETRGGRLSVLITEDDHVFLIGPAVKVFSGGWLSG